MDPILEIVDDERGSHTRVRSARRAAIELDVYERPTLVPDEPVALESLEARVLFDTRAAMERRLAIATQQDLCATRRLDAVVLDEQIHISLDSSELDRAFERRRAVVRTIALLFMLAFLCAVAVVVFHR